MSFVSPIKNGEYWANGLPIIVSKGIGDDARIIEEDKEGGYVLDPSNNSIEKIYENIVSKLSLSRNASMALKHRSFENVSKAYKTILNR